MIDKNENSVCDHPLSLSQILCYYKYDVHSHMEWRVFFLHKTELVLVYMKEIGQGDDCTKMCFFFSEKNPEFDKHKIDVLS